MELILGRQVIRPEIAGLMGAYGAALYAKEHEEEGKSTDLLSKEEIKDFSISTSGKRCDKCPNHCLLTIIILFLTEKALSAVTGVKGVVGK